MERTRTGSEWRIADPGKLGALEEVVAVEGSAGGAVAESGLQLVLPPEHDGGGDAADLAAAEVGA
jgi:hypothetical protein